MEVTITDKRGDAAILYLNQIRFTLEKHSDGPRTFEVHPFGPDGSPIAYQGATHFTVTVSDKQFVAKGQTCRRQKMPPRNILP